LLLNLSIFNYTDYNCYSLHVDAILSSAAAATAVAAAFLASFLAFWAVTAAA
jgi:hypothetical protein